MRSSALIVTLVALAAVCGCKSDSTQTAFSQSVWDPFGLVRVFSPEQEPIRIAVVTDGRTAWDVSAWWDLRSRTPWTDLSRELARHTGRPVQIEPMKLFQVAAHLDSGYVDFALLSDTQIEAMKNFHDQFDVIARADMTDRTGLIVTKANSDIHSIADIAGHRFAFGPRGDPVLHYGAAAKLESSGVSLDKVQRELLPFNALQYHVNSLEVAKEVAYGTTGVGVIARSDYEKFAETGGHLLPLSFSKDQFRVLGETSPLDFGPFVASRRTDPEIVRSVTDFLVDAATEQPQVTRSLGVTAFASVHRQRQGDTEDSTIIPVTHNQKP